MVRDVVNYSGTAYIAKTAHTNKQPDTNPTDWDVMVAKTTTVQTATATGNAPQATATCPAGMVATGGGANAVGATTDGVTRLLVPDARRRCADQRPDA